MSAPASDLSFSSVSSSGHVDGLGRRSLSFDRETGAMLERLHVRPQLAVFEQLLRQRVDRLSNIEEERFARPSAVERDASSGELVVVAEFVTGSRLSELLDVSADSAAVPGVDVALGYLLESLPALSTLHTVNRAVHGLIDPSRTVVTAEGQVVFLDLAFGPAVEALHLTPQRLWREFGISAPTEGRVKFDPVDDVTQAALAALMLVVGRNLQPEEYPDAIPTLLMEVIEVAQIRGTTAFAGGLQRILQRSLPLPGRRPYATADEMLGDVRQLVKKEIGLDVCRQAVIDFVAQMDAAFANATPAADRSGNRTETTSVEPRVPELDHFLDTFEVADTEPSHAASVRHDDAPEQEEYEESESEDQDDQDSEETELSLDHFEPVAAARPERPDSEEVYDLAGLDDLTFADPAALSSELAAFDEHRTIEKPPQHAAPVVSEPERAPDIETVARETDTKVETPAAPPATDEAEAEAEAEAPTPEQAHVEEAQADPFAAAAAAIQEETAAAPAEPEPEHQHESGSSRRRKRQQMKSARARKDKLRSTTDQKPAPVAPPPPPKPATPSGWLVSPHRAAASESLIPEPQHIPVPQPSRPVQVPPVSFTPTPVGPLPQPTYANPTMPSPVYGSPTIVKPQPPPPPPTPVQAPPSATLKIKTDPPASLGSTRRTIPEPEIVAPPDRFSTLSLGRNNDELETPREFPWKLAAVAVGVALIAIIAGRSYLPGRTAVAGEPGAPAENAAAPATPPVAPAEPKADATIPAGKGRVAIQTQPPGIKVLLDRKPIGETPVQIDTTPGRHVLTFITSGGEVLHSVRVVAGKTVPLDLPVFSGWVAVFAPILLDISENGRSLGTTEQNRLMLPPGRHELTFTNKEFGFSEVRSVDIEPGGVRNVTVEVRGTANINAIPWAEVWLDGTKLGETPLAGTPVPLGTREFVFKHPQHGERKVSATIRANVTAQITMDFTK